MEDQWSLWLQVSDGCNGTSRLPSRGDAGLAQSLSQGAGWDKVVPAWLGGTGIAWKHTDVHHHRCCPGLESTAVPTAYSCGSAPPGTRWGAPLEKRGPLGKGSLGSGWRSPMPDTGIPLSRRGILGS